jgi:hypothetical protein
MLAVGVPATIRTPRQPPTEVGPGKPEPAAAPPVAAPPDKAE